MKFEHVTIVMGSLEEVFALTQDYSRRLSWDPFLRRAELLDGAIAPGIGIRSWCIAKSGLGMETEYVAFTPPRIAAVKMTRGPWILESFGGAWEFTPIDSDATQVAFRYQFRTRPRWLAWLLEPVARRWFSWETKKRVVALQAMLESSGDVDRTRL